MVASYQAEQLHAVLQQRFHFSHFRPGQQEAMLLLLNCGSVLCIHPTGFGKSLLYQLPAVLLDGITVVISPLLALMRDQEQQLKVRFNIAAGALNSDQSPEENAAVWQLIDQGQLCILFLAPEQLEHIDRFQALLKLPIRLIVVDEAHCISIWGHDFRPSYRQIVHFIKALRQRSPSLKILGLTATADKQTEEDIQGQLSLPEQPLRVLRESMNRPNISLHVFTLATLEEKLAACEQLIHQLEGCGLIYCATRESTSLVANYLSNARQTVAAYHAGLEAALKKQLQHDFLADKYKAIVATNALGMGIDKSNLRFIIHFDVPGSLTAYYQEVGRCGRDGHSACGVLLYDPADRRVQRYFIESAQPTPEDFATILHHVRSAAEPPNLNTIKRLTGLHPTRVLVVVTELIEQGFLIKSSCRGVQVYTCTDRAAQPNLQRYHRQHKIKLRELQRMLSYAEQQRDCRMALLRQTLGDTRVERCGHCCACQPGLLVLPKNTPKAVAAAGWLSQQGVEIAASKQPSIAAGIALLDAKLRAPLCMSFMRQRNQPTADAAGLDRELLAQLYRHLIQLAATYTFTAVVPLPSRTWCHREAVAAIVGKTLQAQVLPELLIWRELPAARQGELLNNDQRRYNVHQRLTVAARPSIAPGSILLLDDYIGSGNTLKEAARALQKEGCYGKHILVPFTLVAVKWKLGSAGMV